MDVHLQVNFNGSVISLSKAVEKGYVRIVGNKIEPQDNVLISVSSRLFDSNNNELFEDDIVLSKDGKYYKVVYDFGIFYLQDKDQVEKIPLYVHKLKHNVDVEKCNNFVF